jgi:hypothetical protein
VGNLIIRIGYFCGYCGITNASRSAKQLSEPKIHNPSPPLVLKRLLLVFVYYMLFVFIEQGENSYISLKITIKWIPLKLGQNDSLLAFLPLFRVELPLRLGRLPKAWGKIALRLGKIPQRLGSLPKAWGKLSLRLGRITQRLGSLLKAWGKITFRLSRTTLRLGQSTQSLG